MKRSLLLFIVMLLPLMAMSQGVITRPQKQTSRTTSEQKPPAKQKKTKSQGDTTRSEKNQEKTDSEENVHTKQELPSTSPASVVKDDGLPDGTSIPVTVNGVTFNMIKVEGGAFMMGATSEQQNPNVFEKPTHKVTLSSYYIGETEVTQALWKAVMGSNPSYFKGDDLPVEKVSWDDCQDFILKLNNLTGRSFRLPTEAEWEFAARGGNKSSHTQYSGSGNIDEVAWYYDNSGSKTHLVKTKKANELGIYDMSGNVWEWCQDWNDSYSSGAQDNPTGPDRGTYRMRRGGSWYEYAWGCRSSIRNHFITPDCSNYGLGLRLVLSE